MALKVADRVKETSTTTGTGTLNLGGAASGYQTFVAGIGTGNTCYYAIVFGTEWEVGIGTITDATPDTLSRDTVLASSNSGSLVSFSAGTKDVFITLPASRIVTNVVDLAWGKKFFVDAGLLPATERIVASLNTCPTEVGTFGGTFTKTVGGGIWTAADNLTYWDLGALRSEVLVVLCGAQMGGGAQMGLSLSVAVPSSVDNNANSFTAWIGSGAEMHLDRNVYPNAVVKGTATGFRVDTNAGRSVGMAIYYNDTTNVLKMFVRDGSGGWILVVDTTDSTFTTVRYVTIHRKTSGVSRLILPFTAWSE